MRILFLAPYFPPHNTIGAIRTGKLARFLDEQGHDVHVISAIEAGLAKTLPLEIAPERVSYVRRLNVNALPEAFMGGREKLARDGFGSGSRGLLGLGRFYKTLFNVPDAFCGWIPWALSATMARIEAHRPDLILVSACPWSGLVVAALAARRSGLPWFADLRDPWTDSLIYDLPWPRSALDRMLENRLLASAAGIIGVSEPWSEALARRHGRPVLTMRNGFDPADVAANPPERLAPEGTLSIVHTGLLLHADRDLSPLLLDALSLLRPNEDALRVSFVGTKLQQVPVAAKARGVEAHVRCLPAVPHARALAMQAGADLLLLVSREPGCYPGKLYEYAAQGRPILHVGPENDVAGRLVHERGLGVSLASPEAIAAHLAERLATFRKEGSPPHLPPEAAKGLTRDEQFARLVPFLKNCMKL